MSLKIGTVHPIAKKNVEAQLSVAKENKEFLDIIFYNTSKSKDYPKAWEKSTLRYGLYVEGNIPFILSELPQEKRAYAIAINMYEVAQASRTAWVQETEATMNIFLINAANSMIEGMRTINFNEALAKDLRKACQMQLTQYKDAASVTAAANTIVAKTNAATMVSKGKMISLLQV
jgi:hypothetical protein